MPYDHQDEDDGSDKTDGEFNGNGRNADESGGRDAVVVQLS